jgi:GDPmannose 4,6-dehydratase
MKVGDYADGPKRDWGFAGDYVRAMWMILQAASPEDFVISTGETHTVREFVEAAFGEAGFRLEWRGEGKKERGVDSSTGRALVLIDPRYFRPAEVDILLGDFSKAKRILGWEPTVRFRELVAMMFKADLDAAERELYMKEGGFRIRGSHE